MAPAPAPKRNARVVLAERPKRGPITPKTFRQEEVDLPELKDGEVLVKVDYVSVDPTMRTWINPTRNYMRPVELGEVMRAGGIGRVVLSRSKGLVEGDLVYGTLGWQEYWVGQATKLERRTTPKGGRDVDHLGLFGVSGMTAYFGMFDIGRIKNGDNVVVSGAAGSVGLIATQIALAYPKCRVTAIAGSPSKLEALRKLGCHHTLNYKDKDFPAQLKKVGLVDLYFDNVGGEILNLVLAQVNPYARIVACGAIAAYNSNKALPIYNLPVLISMKVRMEGFIALDYASRYPEARTYLADQLQRGNLHYEYTIFEPESRDRSGLGRCTEALEMMFKGENIGKTLVKISNEEMRGKL